MTWATQLLVMYAVVGLAVSCITLRIFPPMEGFQPSLGVRASAGLCFAILWPFLVLLALWYLAVGYLGRTRQQKPLAESHASIELASHAHMTVPSKPR